VAKWGRKVYISEGGDECDSQYEVDVVNDLIERGVEYEYHPGPYEYSRPARGGFCLDCDSNNVRKGALYEPDLRIIRTGVIIELKGGSITSSSRGRLRDFVRNGTLPNPNPLHFMFRDNRIIKGLRNKRRHRDWADSLGCPVHIGMTVPKEWT
jgi:hypothetical protein